LTLRFGCAKLSRNPKKPGNCGYEYWPARNGETP
jgi:hypothetical protein